MDPLWIDALVRLITAYPQYFLSLSLVSETEIKNENGKNFKKNRDNVVQTETLSTRDIKKLPSRK